MLLMAVIHSDTHGLTFWSPENSNTTKTRIAKHPLFINSLDMSVRYLAHNRDECSSIPSLYVAVFCGSTCLVGPTYQEARPMICRKSRTIFTSSSRSWLCHDVCQWIEFWWKIQGQAIPALHLQQGKPHTWQSLRWRHRNSPQENTILQPLTDFTWDSFLGGNENQTCVVRMRGDPNPVSRRLSSGNLHTRKRSWAAWTL